MLVGAVTGLFWLSNPGAPASQVRDALNALPVYSSRVVALGALHEKLHASVQQLLRRMLAHVVKVTFLVLKRVAPDSIHQFHTTGIAWEDPGMGGAAANPEPEKAEVIDGNRVIQVGLCFDVLYDRYMCEHVAPWIQVAQRIHPLLGKQAELARLAFMQLRELIVKSQRHRPPVTEAAVSMLLQPLVSAVRAVEGMCEADDDCDDEAAAQGYDLCANHLRLVAGGINALLWVISNAGQLPASLLTRTRLSLRTHLVNRSTGNTVTSNTKPRAFIGIAALSLHAFICCSSLNHHDVRRRSHGTACIHWAPPRRSSSPHMLQPFAIT